MSASSTESDHLPSTLTAATREITRLRWVCDNWAEKYASWRDACLAAEAERDRLRTAVRYLGDLADSYDRQAEFCRTLSGSDSLMAAECHETTSEKLRELISKVTTPSGGPR